MGSGFSKQGHVQASMFITLESNNIISGGIIRGSIHIALAEKLTNPLLYLIFKGNEVIDFRMQHFHFGNNSHYYTEHLGKQLICCLKATLYPWPDMLAFPGNFTIPFELQVHDNLLPSFHALSLWGGSSQINYSLRAQLHAADRKPMKFKMPVFVFTNTITLPPDMYPQALSHECSGRSSILCCFNREYVNSRMWIERGTFGNFDHIDVNLETDLSRFSENISSVEIEVNKILTMRANKKNSKVCTQVVNMLKISESPEIKGFSGAQQFSFRIPIQSILKNEHCYTISSQLIKCHFVLNVRLKTAFTCFKIIKFNEASQNILILPFQVQVPMISPPIAPEQWQSQLLPQSNIDLKTQDSNDPNQLNMNSFLSTNKSELTDKVTPICS